MSAFQPGDVVAIPSGGPLMTVLGTDPSKPNALACAWFDAAGHYREQRFPAAALVSRPPVGAASRPRKPTT